MSEHIAVETEREAYLFAACYMAQAESCAYYARTRTVLANWMAGCRSIQSFQYNAARAADTSKTGRVALFKLIGDGSYVDA